jgi:paraquat-inducible protein B
MARRANPSLIGAFVIGAVTLGVLLVVSLGSRSLFAQTRHFVVVFKSSLYGLSVGAPVALRGVTIGQVKAISPVIIVSKGQPTGVDILVTIEISSGQFRTTEGSPAAFQEMSDAELAKVFDKEGVRAQLAIQSFVTGQLYVNLDFYPESPANVADVATPYPQIGTIQTGLEKLGKTIETLPLDQLAVKAMSVLEGLEKTINSPEIPEILSSLDATAENAQKITAKLDASLSSLVAQVSSAAEAATGAMNQAKTTLALDSGVPSEVASNLIATLDQARKTIDLKQGPAAELVARLNRVADTAEQTLVEARGAMAEAKDMLNDRSTTRQDLEQMLTEFAGAARSIRSLANYLDRHPEALIRGKGR